MSRFEAYQELREEKERQLYAIFTDNEDWDAACRMLAEYVVADPELAGTIVHPEGEAKRAEAWARGEFCPPRFIYPTLKQAKKYLEDNPE